MSLFFLSCLILFAVLSAVTKSQTKRLSSTELANARKLWDSQKIDNYEMEYAPSCFCIRCFVLPKLVTVFDDDVQFVEFANEEDRAECEELGFIDSVLNPSSYETINQLFQVLEDNIETAASIQATFDEELGYPTSGSIDFNELIADEEKFWTISSVTPLDDDDDDDDDFAGITRECKTGEIATLTIDKFSSCSDILLRGKDIGATVCAAFETDGEEENLLVVFSTESSYYEIKRIWLNVDDYDYSYPVTTGGYKYYSKYDYKSGKLCDDDDKNLYVFEIPASKFDVTDNVCDFCYTRYKPSLYLSARVQLTYGRRKGRLAYVETQLQTMIECENPDYYSKH